MNNPDRSPRIVPCEPAALTKLHLFDFDGTLADTREIAHEILNEMAVEFGFRQLPPDQLEAARLMNTRQFMSHLGISTWRLPLIARRGHQLLHERIHHVNPIAGIPEVLATLKDRGERLAILSSNSEANVKAFLSRHHLPSFEFVKSSSKLFGKGREIRRILRKESLAPPEILYIGDETRDIEAARETGLRMAAVTWGYNSSEALGALRPDHLISRPEEILSIKIQA
jgi:phosphoglycolate phosphatase-like HAD superfamily hydrolase